jgi:hypothetical protein
MGQLGIGFYPLVSVGMYVHTQAPHSCKRLPECGSRRESHRLGCFGSCHGPLDIAALIRAKPTIVDPKRFPDVAAMLARLCAEAATSLASIKANRRL